MKADELQTLIAQGESLTLEFKSDRAPLADDEMVEALVCLANHQGGTLLVGVEDNGTISGLHPKHQSTPGALAGFIASRTVPPLSVDVEFVDAPPGKVAVIETRAARQLVSASDGKVLVRYQDAHGKPGCRPLYPHEWTGWRADRGQTDYSAQPIEGISWQELDPLEFARLRHMVEENRGDSILLSLSDQDISRALGLAVESDGQLVPTVAGLLLVGKESTLCQFLPAHEVAFQVLRGLDVAVNEFRRGPLLRTLEWVLESFQVRNEERELNLGLFRVGVPTYDRRGFREAVNNAFIHRDYTRLGATHIQIHDDRIQISNPGGFVQGVVPENLLVTEPHPRNPRLADAFKRIGLVERVGRGVSIIFAGQLRNGRTAPDYSRSTLTSVTVTLPGGHADLKFVELLVTEENRRQKTFNVSELLILAHLWHERQIDTATATRLTQRGETEMRAAIEALVEMGLVEARGGGKGRNYLLSASVYRALGQPASYVRTRGFEPEQMEQMVVQYVNAHGRITRHETADLCRINLNQAAYLLKKLTLAGEVALVGTGRKAEYKPLKAAKTRKNSE